MRAPTAQAGASTHTEPHAATSQPRWSLATFAKPTSGRNQDSMVWGSESIAATMCAPPFLVVVTSPADCRGELRPLRNPRGGIGGPYLVKLFHCYSNPITGRAAGWDN